jgi:hypothetical protein
MFNLAEVPLRKPPESPLPPQWYKLESKAGQGRVRGEVMLAIWWGTQADEAFPDAWHSDTGNHAHFRSKMYSSPRLWYLRVKVIEAQDLIPPDKGHLPEPVGSQISSGADLSLMVDSQFHDTTGFVYLWMFLCASDHLSRH